MDLFGGVLRNWGAECSVTCSHFSLWGKSQAEVSLGPELCHREVDTGRVNSFYKPLQWVQSQILFFSSGVLEHLWTLGLPKGTLLEGDCQIPCLFRGRL